MPRARAQSSPAASGRLAMTATTSAGQPWSRQAWTSACMLLPRPEIRMTRRRLIREESGKIAISEKNPRGAGRAFRPAGHFTQERRRVGDRSATLWRKNARGAD